MKCYNYKGLLLSEIENKCREQFIETYVKDTNNNRIIIKTTAGERVVFNENDFKHAFSFSDKRSGDEKFSLQRARRVLWIKKVVTGSCPSVRKDLGRDVYFYYNSAQKYLVFLKKMSRGGLRFITHYIAKSDKKQKWIKKHILA